MWTDLAAYAGAELRAPRIRPEHCSSSLPLQPSNLQLLQPARYRPRRRLCRPACHFHVSAFPRETPVFHFLGNTERKKKKNKKITRWDGYWVNLTEATDDRRTSPHTELQTHLGKSGGAGCDEIIVWWKPPVYSKLSCEALPKLSTQQEKQCLMGHFFPNYPEDEENPRAGAGPSAGTCMLTFSTILWRQISVHLKGNVRRWLKYWMIFWPFS